MAGRLMQVDQQVHILGSLDHTSLPFCSAPLLSAVGWPEFKGILSLGQRHDPRVGVQGPGVLWPFIQSVMASRQIKDNESCMAGFQNSLNGIEAGAVPNVLGPWSGGEAPQSKPHGLLNARSCIVLYGVREGLNPGWVHETKMGFTIFRAWVLLKTVFS